MNARQVKAYRARFAAWLRACRECSFEEIAAILRCKSKDEARSLVGRGENIKRQEEEHAEEA